MGGVYGSYLKFSVRADVFRAAIILGNALPNEDSDAVGPLVDSTKETEERRNQRQYKEQKTTRTGQPRSLAPPFGGPADFAWILYILICQNVFEHDII